MPKIDPYKYLASGKAYNEMRELRPGLAGVYHENGNVYASDAHILVRLKQDYPKSLEKKLIGKDGKEVSGMMNGKPTGQKAKPAGFERVIPNIKTINEDYAVYAIDPLKLKEKLKGKKIQDDLFVSFVDKDSGKFVSKFNAGYLLKVADFMIKTKHPFALLHVSNSTKPMLVNTTEGELLMLMPVSNYNPGQEFAEIKIERILDPQKPSSRSTKIEKVRQPATPKPKSKPKKPTTMTRKKTTAKAHGSSTTMRDASRILKAQKDDYQKIFRAEVKKSKDPKAGAKKAGKIYRDRYGATATARWKKALKRAK